MASSPRRSTKRLLTPVGAVLATSFMTLLACKGEEKPCLATSACQAAEQYYQCLIEERYQDFADGIISTDLGTGFATSDTLPADYRNELADAAAQYAVTEPRKHNGLKAAHALSATVEGDSTHASVNLELTFGDSTHEEILLSLILTSKGWKMR